MNTIFTKHNILSILITLLIYIVFLLSLPRILTLTTPCLRSTPGASYSDSSCNIDLVLDRLVILIALGFAIIILASFIFNPNRHIIQILIMAILMTIMTIATFYWYLPHLEAIINQAQIVLEPESFN